MKENDSYFIRHQASIIIIIVAVFISVGLLIWLGTIRQNNLNNGQASQGGLTQDQIQAIVNNTPTGSETINSEDRAAIMKNDASGPEALTPEQRNSILQNNAK